MCWELNWKFGVVVFLLAVGVATVCGNGVVDPAENKNSNVDIEGTKLMHYAYWDMMTHESELENLHAGQGEGEDESEDELIEGDIIVASSGGSSDNDSGGGPGKRKVVPTENKLWPYGEVPYTIVKSGKYKFKNYNNAKAVITEAIDAWMAATCLKFVFLDSPNSAASKAEQLAKLGHNNYLSFRTSAGCSSFVGFNPGYAGQEVNLNEMGCLKVGIAIHEIGHSVGFYHEQSRKDSEGEIDIIWGNIKTSAKKNFNATETKYEAAYDLGSVMHYGIKTFTNNGAETIKAVDANMNFLLGNAEKLSFYDKKAANKAYKCQGGCNSYCENSGFDSLIDGNCTCICPSVLAGNTCEAIDSTWTDPVCESVVVTLNETDSYEIKSPGYPGKYDNMLCGWLVKNPYNLTMTISLTLDNIPRNSRTHKCYHSVEIRYNLVAQAGPSVDPDQTAQIRGQYHKAIKMIALLMDSKKGDEKVNTQRFCGTTSVPYLIESHNTSVMVLFHASDTDYAGHSFKVNISTGLDSVCLPNPCKSNLEYCTDIGGGQYNCTCHENLSGQNCSIVDTILCNFDGPEWPLELCLFSRDPIGNFNWSLHKGPTPSGKTGPDHDVAGNAMYLYAEASHPNSKGWIAILTSAVIQGRGEKCFSFYYHMYGSKMGQLFVTFTSVANAKHKVIWHVVGNQGNKWKLENITVSSQEKFKVEVKAIRGKGYTSDIAIDSVLLTIGACNQNTSTANLDNAMSNCPAYLSGPDCDTVDAVNCTFDQPKAMDNNMGWCIFHNNIADDFNWSIHKGKTPSKKTGPTGDKTSIGNKNYLYAEASKIKKNAVAIIDTPLIKAGEICVGLWYHMYGVHMGTLQILFEDINGALAELFQFGNQKNYWHPAYISVTSEQNYKISVVSIRGSNYKSDIAIDGFNITRELCPSPNNTITLPGTLGTYGEHHKEQIH